MEQTWVNWNTFRGKLEHRQGYIGAQTGYKLEHKHELNWSTDRGILEHIQGELAHGLCLTLLIFLQLVDAHMSRSPTGV